MFEERQQTKTALLVLAGYNLVQNTALNERGYVAGNLAVTAALVGLGRDAGLDWDEMGLGWGEGRSSLWVGATVLVTSTAFLFVGPRLPAMRAHLRDERAPSGPQRETMQRAFVRFPLGTALFEEVAFRGVLPGLLAGRRRSGDLASAVAFGLWHLIPTHHALLVNRIGQGRGTRIIGTLMGAVAAGVAGYVLGWVRRATGSLFASWLIHSAINTTSYLAVIRARSVSADGTQLG